MSLNAILIRSLTGMVLVGSVVACQKPSNPKDEDQASNASSPQAALPGFPISGSELTYQPELWTGKNNSNCYSYACNDLETRDPTLEPVLPFPGRLSGYPALVQGQRYSGAMLKERFLADVKSQGMSDRVYEVNLTTPCPKGTYKIVYQLGNLYCNGNKIEQGVGVDFHWMRQDDSGRWSNRPGTRPVTDLDDLGQVILDPRTASVSVPYVNPKLRDDIKCIIKYEDTAGCFCIPESGLKVK